MEAFSHPPRLEKDAPVALKRQRSRNFTKYEKRVFYNVLTRYADVISDRSSPLDVVRTAWEQLLQDYNSQQNVFPRTRRQLQVLWRDEKFRAKKREKKDQAEDVENCDRTEPNSPSSERQEDVVSPNEQEVVQSTNLLSPLLSVIKREREAFAAAEATMTILPLPRRQQVASSIPQAPQKEQGPPPTNTIATPQSISSSETCDTSNQGMPSPLPVETELHSGSSSPVIPQEHDEDNYSSDEDKILWRTHHQGRTRRDWTKDDSSSAETDKLTTDKREEEYHKLRVSQLKEEGNVRLRVMKAELALLHQQRHMLQQEHSLKMEILMEKLKRVRDGLYVKD